MWIWWVLMSESPARSAFAGNVLRMSHSSVDPISANSVGGVSKPRPPIERLSNVGASGSSSTFENSTWCRVGALLVSVGLAGNREGDSVGGVMGVVFCTVNCITTSVVPLGFPACPTVLITAIFVPAANFEKSTRMSARSVMPIWTLVTEIGAGRYPPSEPMTVKGASVVLHEALLPSAEMLTRLLLPSGFWLAFQSPTQSPRLKSWAFAPASRRNRYCCRFTFRLGHTAPLTRISSAPSLYDQYGEVVGASPPFMSSASAELSVPRSGGKSTFPSV